MRFIHTSTLKPFRNGKVRYAASFVSPSRDFRIVLAGKTKSGYSFRRLARGVVIPRTTMIYIISTPDGLALKAGNSRGTTIMLGIRTFGKPEHFKINILDEEKFGQALTSSRAYIIKGRLAVYAVRYKAPRNAKKGVTHRSIVVAVGEKKQKRRQVLLSHF